MTIHQLYAQVYSDEKTKNPEVFIDIYETNKELIDGSTINGDKEVYNKVMRLTADYAHHLTMMESYKKALPKIDKAIGLFKAYPDFIGTDLFKLQFYESLVFDRAVSNYYLKNYKEAKGDLQMLTERFPDNDKYRNWLAVTQIYSTQTFINILWYVIAAVVIVTAIYNREDIGVFYDVVLYLGAAALIAAVTAEIVKAVRKRKIKRALTGVQIKAG